MTSIEVWDSTVKIVGTGLGAVLASWVSQRKRIPSPPMERPKDLTIDSAHYRLGVLEKKFGDFQDKQDDRHKQNSRRLNRVLKKLDKQGEQQQEIMMLLAKKAGSGQ